MTWVRIDDAVATHPKHLAAGPVACWIWVAGLAWANQHASNGTIPAHALHALYPSDWISKAELRRVATKLVEVGLWEKTADGWLIHDYADYQAEAMKTARDERREWERKRKAAQRAAKKAPTATSDSEDLGALSHRDRLGHVPGTTGGTGGGTSPGTGALAVSHPPGPARPDLIENTHTPAGATRLGTVELFGITGDEVLATLRAGSKGRINLAHEARTLADLDRLVSGLSTQATGAVVGIEPYQHLAAWVAAGGLAWFDHGAPTLGYLLKPGTLATHLAEAAAWHASGRPAIPSRKATAAAAAVAPRAPLARAAGPLPAAPRSAFEHATLATRLGVRWRAPTDGADRDAAFLAQTGFTVDEARRRVAALPSPTSALAPAGAPR